MKLKSLFFALLAGLSSFASHAQAELYFDEATFLAETDARLAPLPDPSTLPVFPCIRDWLGCVQDLWLSAGQYNIHITAPNSNSPNVGAGIRNAIDLGPNIMYLNPINPDLAFVANGEDDMLFRFETPVTAIGLEIITNYAANETITLFDVDGNIISILQDIQLETLPNQYEFIGITSVKPIAAMFLDNQQGAKQNEAVSRVFVGEALNTHACPGEKIDQSLQKIGGLIQELELTAARNELNHLDDAANHIDKALQYRAIGDLASALSEINGALTKIVNVENAEALLEEIALLTRSIAETATNGLEAHVDPDNRHWMEANASFTQASNDLTEEKYVAAIEGYLGVYGKLQDAVKQP